MLQIGYELSFAAPFHLGTGVSAGLIDRTVIRDTNGELYVPASTFKGVLREHCEQLYRFYVPNAQDSIVSPHDAYAALAEFNGVPTLLTHIFGSPLYPGGLRFNDATQVGNEAYRDSDYYRDLQTSISTQVRIDRITRTAAEKALYTSEFGSSALTFAGIIKGQLSDSPIESLLVTGQDEKQYTGMPTYALLLLLAGLLLVERLGSNKSTGKGQCQCRIANVVIDGRECTEQQWSSWVERLDELGRYAYDTKGARA